MVCLPGIFPCDTANFNVNSHWFSTFVMYSGAKRERAFSITTQSLDTSVLSLLLVLRDHDASEMGKLRSNSSGPSTSTTKEKKVDGGDKRLVAKWKKIEAVPRQCSIMRTESCSDQSHQIILELDNH